MNQRGLARTRNASDARHQSDREYRCSTFFRLCSDAPVRRMRLGPGPPAFFRQGNPKFAAEVLSGQGRRGTSDLVERALKDDLAAVLAGSRAKIENVVRGADDFRIVFDDEHRVSDVAQPEQDLNEALRVARVKPDRGFVEDIQARPPAKIPATSQAGCAAPLRRTASRRAGPASGTEGQRRSGNEGVNGSPRGCVRRLPVECCVSSTPEKKSLPSRMVMRQTSAMFLPAT